MKKIFFALFLGLSFNVVIAQSIKAGLKAGVNISNFSGSSVDDLDKTALVGFHAGAYINFMLAGISIQPEALVSTAGMTIKEAGETDKVTLTYVTIPVMVKLNTKSGFYVEAGPQVGFKIGEKYGDETIEDFAKGLDLSLGAGLGFQTKSGFGLGGRYLLGISKVGDFDPSFGNVNDFKNGVIQLGIFYTFHSSK